MTQLGKGKRIGGELREQVGRSLAERYLAGESIRSLAADSGAVLRIRPRRAEGGGNRFPQPWWTPQDQPTLVPVVA